MFKVIIWGTGKLAKRYMEAYYKHMHGYVHIVAFIDNDKEKQKRKFYGYPVIPYERANNYGFDYIVIMNAFTKQIYQQLGKEVENDSIVISSEQFFQLFVDSGYWRDKKVLLYGDCMNNALIEYRARFTFKSFQYLKENKAIPTDNFDFVFLSPPRLLPPQEKTAYEEKLRKEINHKLIIENEKVLCLDEWIYYFQCDRKIEGGKRNQDKKFFIIASSDPMQGWGNILVRIWGGIAYAHNHQMIPVVDMKNLKNQYLPDALLGKHNVWEDFFQPLNEYDLDEVYDSQHVVLSGIDTHILGAMETESTVYKQQIACQLERAYNTLFPAEGKVLGVVYRGTDYNRAHGHTASGDLEDYIEYIKRYMLQIGYEYIFLATEVEEATNKFEKEFGKRVFWSEQERYKAAERRWLYSIHFDRENDEFKKGMEYITVLDLLSKCDAIVGTDTGTVRAAVVLNQKKYEYVNILGQ